METSTKAKVPTIGAALPIARLESYADWLIADQRDLELWDPFDPAVLDSDWKPLVRQASGLLDGYSGRLGIHGPYDGFRVITMDRSLRQLICHRLRQALDFAAELGASQMVLHSPFYFLGSAQVAHSSQHGLARQIDLVHELLDEIVALAQQVNCTLVFENILDRNPAPLLALVDSFASERVRVSLDVGHAAIAQRVGGPPPHEWVRAAGARLAHLHLDDTDGEYDYHWVPGDGPLNWVALFEALGELADTPRLLIEMDYLDDIKRGVAFLASKGLGR
jgi:sugar phosphate isomerase/epimerase